MQKAKTKLKDYGLPKEGMQMARIVRVIDLGLQERQPFQGEVKAPAYFIRVTFELPKDRIDVDGESRPRWIDTEINLSNHEKSKCFQYYNTLDPKNKCNGDWGKLIGTPCQILIAHRESSQRKMFANIKNIVPLMEGLEVPALENPTAVFDVSNPRLEIFESLPEWLQEKIKGNLEYDGSKLQRLVEGSPVPATASTGRPQDEEAEVDVAARPTVIPEVSLDDVADDFDDDAPF